MKIALCILMGYLLGSLSPSALIARIKKKNIRKSGSGNLGATNTLLHFGRGFGVAVMVFDIAKSSISVLLARLIFRSVPLAGLIAGGAAVLGHIFPFYLKFRGGKGLASFGGLVLAYDPLVFLFLLILCVGLMLVVNHGAALPVSAGLLFPLLATWRTEENAVLVLILAAIPALLVILRHTENIKNALTGNDVDLRHEIKERLFSKKG